MEKVVAQARHLVSDYVDPLLHTLQPYAKHVYEGHLYFHKLLSTDHNVIPQMAWENQLAEATGLSLSQFRMTLALFLMVPLVAGVRLFQNPTCKLPWVALQRYVLRYSPAAFKLTMWCYFCPCC